MKKNLTFLAAVLALGLAVPGCKKSESSNPVPQAPPSGPVALTLRWPSGKRILQTFQMQQTMQTRMPNSTNAVNQDMTMEQKVGLTVSKEQPGGGHEIELEFISSRMKVMMGDRVLTDMDTTKKPAANSKPDPAAQIFQQLIGSKIRFTMDASNHVERVDGLADLQKKLLANAPRGSGPMIAGFLKENYFKQMVEHNRYLPDKPVQPGDTWPVQMDVEAGPLGTMSSDYTYTFKDWEVHGGVNCAHLTYEGTLKSKPDANSKLMGMNISMEDTKSSGESWFDPDRGLFVEADVNQPMKMHMEIPARTRPGTTAGTQPQTITMVMDQTITTKLDSVK